jgi:hypothetical protein
MWMHLTLNRFMTKSGFWMANWRGHMMAKQSLQPFGTIMRTNYGDLDCREARRSSCIRLQSII